MRLTEALPFLMESWVRVTLKGNPECTLIYLEVNGLWVPVVTRVIRWKCSPPPRAGSPYSVLRKAVISHCHTPNKVGLLGPPSSEGEPMQGGEGALVPSCLGNTELPMGILAPSASNTLPPPSCPGTLAWRNREPPALRKPSLSLQTRVGSPAPCIAWASPSRGLSWLCS